MTRVHHARARGYTLIEVLTATAILAAVLAIGVPNLVELGKPYALDSAVRQIQADLGDARMRAIARNVRCRLNFNQSAGTWVVERETVLNSNSFVADSRMQKLPRGAELGTVTANPTFTPQGMLVAPVTITISVPEGSSKTVSVNVLGHATIS